MKVLKQKIIDASQEIGIDLIGFTHADPFTEIEDQLRDHVTKGYSSGFEHPVIEERIYVNKIFEEPRSIISIALAYPNQLNDPLPQEKGKRRGLFSPASWGEDYHRILENRMEQLMAFIRQEATTARFKPMVDTGELVDVAVAARAGLGFIGRNGLLITEKFGSYVFLGEIITNLEFEPDEPVGFGCGDCYRCVRSCPTDALLGNGQQNSQRCLSYLTQTKDYFPKEDRRKMGHVIYGCDICQISCPYNQGINRQHHKEMAPDLEKVQPLLEPLLTLSNRGFREKFGHMAGSWRGKRPIQRNAIIALANFREESAIPQLLEIIEKDQSPMIRGTAAWAVAHIQRYQNPQLAAFLEERLALEEDPETRREMSEAIEVLRNKRHPRAIRQRKRRKSHDS